MLFPDPEQFTKTLQDAFELNRLQPLNERSANRFYTLSRELLEENDLHNLTAIRDIHGIVYRHYVDSLKILSLIPSTSRVLDLGCGAGFPSLPLAIYRNDITFAALDATQKKIDFVSSMVGKLGLSNFDTVCGRAEDPQTMKKLGKFDVVVSRAVAGLPILAELCMPYLKVGGLFIAMKGKNADEEIKAAENALKVLGGELMNVQEDTIHEVTVEGNVLEDTRRQILIRKAKETPTLYPRRYAQILKKPL